MKNDMQKDTLLKGYQSIRDNAISLYQLQRGYDGSEKERTRLEKNIQAGVDKFQSRGIPMDAILDGDGNCKYKNLFAVTGDLLRQRNMARRTLREIKKGIQEVEHYLETSEFELEILKLESKLLSYALTENSDIRTANGAESEKIWESITRETSRLMESYKEKLTTELSQNIYITKILAPIIKNDINLIENMEKERRIDE